MGAGLGNNRGDTWAYLLGYAAMPFVLLWGLVSWSAGWVVNRWRKR